MRARPFPGARRWVIGIGLAAALAAPGVDAQPSRDDQREAPEVKKLTFRGVKSVELDELRASIATEASHCKGLLFQPFCWVWHSRLFYQKEYLDHAELARDVLRIQVFYWKRGFREAEVDTTVSRTGGGVRVAFRVKEGPPTVIQTVKVARPDGILTDRQLRRLVLLRAGQPLNMVRLDSTIVRLRDALWEMGYADAIIDDTLGIIADARSANIIFAVDPRWKAVVGDIAVTGNDRVSESTILNSLTIKPGDVFRRSDLIESQRNLYGSNMFKRAVINLPAQSEDSVKAIVVEVQEAPLRDARIAGGFSTVEFGQLNGTWTHYNFFGKGRRLDLQAGLGNLLADQANGVFPFRNVTSGFGGDQSPYLRPTWQASTNLTQPWFQSPRNTIGIGAFAHRRSAPGIFIDRGQGATATFTRNVAERAPVSLNYRFEVARVIAGDVYFCVNFGVCETERIGALRAIQRLSPLSLSGNVNRTNDAFSPTAGYSARVDLEHASALTISDFRYNRASAEGATFLRVRRRGVLAMHARLGWVHALESTEGAVGVFGGAAGQIIHPRKAFYAGGAQSVRGFGENQLGPRVLTVPENKLRGMTVSAGDTTYQCATTTALQDCPVNVSYLKDRDFTPRPVGGSSLLEGSVEYRFPIWQQLGGAVFVDGAFVGQGSLRNVAKGMGALTPGAGVRYYSPVGPIRIDVGVNPHITERLSVITADSAGRIIELPTDDAHRRIYTTGGAGLLSRLVLHLSIGQAF